MAFNKKKPPAKIYIRAKKSKAGFDKPPDMNEGQRKAFKALNALYRKEFGSDIFDGK